MSEIFEVLLFWQKKPISSINIKKVNIIKMEYKKMSHCCRNNSKSNMKIVERGKIDTRNTQIDDRSLSVLVMIPLTHKYITAHFSGLVQALQ
jgi:hypothetical protein